jgi:hypothetical protein
MTQYKSKFQEDSSDVVFNLISSLKEALYILYRYKPEKVHPLNIAEIKDILADLSIQVENLNSSKDVAEIKVPYPK